MNYIEIHYQSPEGPKVTVVKTQELPGKVAQDAVSKGFVVDRGTDNLYIPGHSIISITYRKVSA